MVQWTVEEEWNRFYMRGHRSRETQSVEVLRNAVSVATIRIPIRINPIVGVQSRRWNARDDQVPHGLAEDVLTGGHEFECSAQVRGRFPGRTAYSSTHHPRRCDHRVGAEGQREASTLSWSPTWHCPAELARWLHTRLRTHVPDAKFNVTYDARADRMMVTAASDTTDGDSVQFSSCRLMQLCGISTMPVPSITSARHGRPNRPLLGSRSHSPGILRAVPPSHVRATHAFGTELETTLNRLYYSHYQGGGTRTPDRVSDPSGRIVCLFHSVRSLHSGPPQSVPHRGMTSIQSIDPSVEYTVVHENDRFAFACERRHPDGHVSPLRSPSSSSSTLHRRDASFPHNPSAVPIPTWRRNRVDVHAASTDGCAHVVRGGHATKRFSVHVTTLRR